MFDSLIDFLGDLLYLRGGEAHLDVVATVEADKVTLTLENRGKRKLKFAAVQVRDTAGKRHFPETDLSTGAVLAPGHALKASLGLSKLRAMGGCRIEVLDTTGRAWPVEGAAWHE